MEHIGQCKDERKSKVGRGKDVICAVLGACFSHAPKECKDTLVSKQILDLNYTVLKSENEVLKSSLAFERETGEKLGIQVDQLVIQNNHLKTEVGHLETEADTLKLCLLQLNTEKRVLEKQDSVLDRWLQKVVGWTLILVTFAVLVMMLKLQGPVILTNLVSSDTSQTEAGTD